MACPFLSQCFMHYFQNLLTGLFAPDFVSLQSILYTKVKLSFIDSKSFWAPQFIEE